MEISYGECKDYNSVINLHKQIFSEDNQSFFDSIKTKPYYKTFTAEHNNRVVAYCIITEIAGEAELINIGVDKGYLRRGIAYNLLNYVICNLKSNVMFLEVSTNNLAAINLYKKCGFNQYSIRKNYYGQSDAILMKLQKQ